MYADDLTSLNGKRLLEAKFTKFNNIAIKAKCRHTNSRCEDKNQCVRSTDTSD